MQRASTQSGRAMLRSRYSWSTSERLGVMGVTWELQMSVGVGEGVGVPQT